MSRQRGHVPEYRRAGKARRCNALQLLLKSIGGFGVSAVASVEQMHARLLFGFERNSGIAACAVSV